MNRMLVLCRRVRELHFIDIVDVQQLLDVMGQDVAPVVQRIQRLLLPSYFPGGLLVNSLLMIVWWQFD